MSGVQAGRQWDRKLKCHAAGMSWECLGNVLREEYVAGERPWEGLMQHNNLIKFALRKATLEKVWKMTRLVVERGKTEGKRPSGGTIFRVCSSDGEDLKKGTGTDPGEAATPRRLAPKDQ